MRTCNSFIIFCCLALGISIKGCKIEEIILHGELAGRVTDAISNEPINSALVRLYPGNDSTKTINDGTYSLKGLIPGEYEVEVTKYKYSTSSEPLIISEAYTKTKDFSLSLVPLPKFSRKYLDFGLDSTSLTFTISNIGVGVMSYIIAPSQSWIKVFPVYGSIGGDAQIITVTIDRTGLPSTIHREKILISSTVGAVVVSNTIDVFVNGAMDINMNYYETVKIGTQIWLSRNINTGGFVTTLCLNNGIIERTCYANSEGNCNMFGGYYYWDEAMQYSQPDNGTIGTTQGACPAGWHIPTITEWNSLFSFIGGVAGNAGKLKGGNQYWNPDIKVAYPKVTITNETGFSALPAGFNAYEMSMAVYFWSSSSCEDSESCRYYIRMDAFSNEIFIRKSPKDFYIERVNVGEKPIAVRCVKDP